MEVISAKEKYVTAKIEILPIEEENTKAKENPRERLAYVPPKIEILDLDTEDIVSCK